MAKENRSYLRMSIIKSRFNTTIQCIELICNRNKMYILVKMVSVINQVGIPVCTLLIMQLILNMIQIAQVNYINLLKITVLYVFVNIVQVIIQHLTSFYNSKFSLDFNLWIRGNILEKCAHISAICYEDSETYDLIRRAQNAENGTIIAYFDLMLQIFGTVVSTLTYFMILIRFDLRLMIPIIVIPVIKYHITVRLNKEQFEVMFGRTSRERKKWYYSYMITNGFSYKEFKVFELFDYFINSYKELSEQSNAEDKKIAKKNAVEIGIVTCFEQIIDGVIFGIIIIQGLVGKILIGNVMTYTRSIMQAKSNVQSMLLQYAELKRIELNVQQVLLFLDLPEEDTHSGIIISSINSIEAIDLSFKYPNSEMYILNSISFIIRKGDIILLTGINGSGKTTLMKILLGLYTDYEGRLLVNGIERNKINISSYRALCSGLFQDFIKYEATIQENIVYGFIGEENNRERIDQLFNAFRIDRIKPGFSKEYVLNSQIGNWFESGTQISAGQWQRIALCRTFFKKSELVILDEPTSSLDKDSSTELIDACFNHLHNAIGIFISHQSDSFSSHKCKRMIINNGMLELTD